MAAKGMNRAPAKESPFYAANKVGAADITVGTVGSHACNVAVQLGDANHVPIAEIGSVDVYLSDNADGSTLTSQVPDSFVIGTNGVIIGTLVTSKSLKVISKNDGTFDLTITIAAGHTYYLVVCMKDGSIVVSSIIAIT